MNWGLLRALFQGNTIDVFADFIDPFCYIGFHNLCAVAASQKVTLRWRGFELNPGTPEEGSLLQTAENSDLRQGMWASVKDFAARSGLHLSQPDWVPNTRLAHRLVLGITKTDVKNSLIERIYQAYLIDKKDIGKAAILQALVSEFGISAEASRQLFATAKENEMEKNRQDAVRLQFTGMPGYYFRGKTYFGALSREAWRDILEEHLCSTK